MNSFKTILTLVFIIIMLVFGFLMNDNHKLKIKVKEQDLIIVKLEHTITDQQTELNILAEDSKSKQQAIAALEEKARISSLAAQEAVDRLIELARIERDVHPASGPSSISDTVDIPDNVSGGQNQGTSVEEINEVFPNPAAAKENQKTAGVVNEPSSKKFIDLRNSIYSRYR